MKRSKTLMCMEWKDGGYWDCYNKMIYKKADYVYIQQTRATLLLGE